MEELENTQEICVDTDILIDYLKKKDPGSQAYEKWRGKAAVGMTSITAFELLIGARRAGMYSRRFQEAKSLIQQHQYVFPFDQKSADKASEVGAELMKKGIGIEIRDLFNASICMSRGTPLLTRNKVHYERVAGLKLLKI